MLLGDQMVCICSIAQGDELGEINEIEIMAACLKNAVNSLLPKYGVFHDFRA
jgi:hypothetical protein